MTDNEFDVLDELYFVTSYNDLLKQLDFSDDLLITILNRLKDKGWVKFLKDIDQEWTITELTADQIKQSYFLASKSGLLAHNSQ
jgi:predicted transcriptional regulator